MGDHFTGQLVGTSGVLARGGLGTPDDVIDQTGAGGGVGDYLWISFIAVFLVSLVVGN